jgi:U3 small nucleolar RNA-associated protein 12
VELPGHQSGVRALDISSDDSLIASASSTAVKIWNVDRGECVRTMDSGFGASCERSVSERARE